MANFAGTELKLYSVDNMSDIPQEALDFEWACSARLKYFSMDICYAVSDKKMHVIASRLAVMPELRRVKFQRITINIEARTKKSLGSKIFSSLFSSSASVSSATSSQAANDSDSPPTIDWLLPLKESKTLCALSVNKCLHYQPEKSASKGANTPDLFRSEAIM